MPCKFLELLIGILITLILIINAIVFYTTLWRYCIFPILFCGFLISISYIEIIIILPCILIICIFICINSNPIEIYNTLKIYQLFSSRIRLLYSWLKTINEKEKLPQLKNVHVLEKSKCDVDELDEKLKKM
jgi:hypothetical protein